MDPEWRRESSGPVPIQRRLSKEPNFLSLTERVSREEPVSTPEN